LTKPLSKALRPIAVLLLVFSAGDRTMGHSQERRDGFAATAIPASGQCATSHAALLLPEPAIVALALAAIPILVFRRARKPSSNRGDASRQAIPLARSCDVARDWEIREAGGP